MLVATLAKAATATVFQPNAPPHWHDWPAALSTLGASVSVDGGLIQLGSYQRDECIGQSACERPEPHSLNRQSHSQKGSVAHLDAANVDQVCLIRVQGRRLRHDRWLSFNNHASDGPRRGRASRHPPERITKNIVLALSALWSLALPAANPLPATSSLRLPPPVSNRLPPAGHRLDQVRLRGCSGFRTALAILRRASGGPHVPGRQGNASARCPPYLAPHRLR